MFDLSLPQRTHECGRISGISAILRFASHTNTVAAATTSVLVIVVVTETLMHNGNTHTTMTCFSVINNIV